MNKTQRSSKGATLIELIITIVIMSIAMAAMLSAFSSSMSRSADPMWRNKSLKLAYLYLDEILSKNYDESTPVGGIPASTSIDCNNLGDEGAETRSTYDDVDDYDGLVDAPPINVSNNLHASYDNYQVAVSVGCEADNDSDGFGDVSGLAYEEAKLITVSVTPPGQPAMSFSAYKGNY